jgi:hypothetical protein
VKGSSTLWWSAAALGPIWYQMYGAVLALPAPQQVGQLFALAAPLFPLVGVGLALVWGAAAITLTSLFLWTVITRLRTHRWPSSVANLSLTPRSALLIMLASWCSPVAAQPLWELRRLGIEACAIRGERVVEALERYRREYGIYPRSLQDLVPRYVASVPSPASLGYPKFTYVRAEAGSMRVAYELQVPMPHGGSGDRLLYWPNGDYPDTIYSGEVERVRGWAYVHE